MKSTSIREFSLALLLMALSPTCLAQAVAGSYLECEAAFTDMLVAWEEVVVTPLAAACNVEQGTAQALAFGVSQDDDTYQLHTSFDRQAGEKRCIGSFGVQGTNVVEFDYILTGKDAADWNGFLKGTGCELVLSLHP